MPHDCEQQELNVGDTVFLNEMFVKPSRKVQITSLNHEACLCEYTDRGRTYVVPTSCVRKAA